jgi:ribosomal protein S25
MENKNKYLGLLGFLGLLGLLGFTNPWFFLFFLFFLFFWAPKPAVQKSWMPASTEAKIEQKEENKKKILKELTLRQAQGGNARISNNDVQKLLGVSDATAERYLNELEKEGKLKQVGGEEKDTYYSKP